MFILVRFEYLQVCCNFFVSRAAVDGTIRLLSTRLGAE